MLISRIESCFGRWNIRKLWVFSLKTFSDLFQQSARNLCELSCILSYITNDIDTGTYNLGPGKMTNFHQINSPWANKTCQNWNIGMLRGSFNSLSAIVFDEISGRLARFKLPHIGHLNMSFEANEYHIKSVDIYAHPLFNNVQNLSFVKVQPSGDFLTPVTNSLQWNFMKLSWCMHGQLLLVTAHGSNCYQLTNLSP